MTVKVKRKTVYLDSKDRVIVELSGFKFKYKLVRGDNNELCKPWIKKDGYELNKHTLEPEDFKAISYWGRIAYSKAIDFVADLYKKSLQGKLL